MSIIKKYEKIYEYIKDQKNRESFIEYFNENISSFIFDKMLEAAPDLKLKSVNLLKFYGGNVGKFMMFIFSSKEHSERYIDIIIEKSDWREGELEYSGNSTHFEISWDDKKIFEENLNNIFTAFNRVKIIQEIENEEKY
jgi:hypothetical protein